MLNCKPAYDQPVNDNLQGIVVDSANKTYWLFSPSDIYEIVITDEDRDVWEIFLARRQFDSALKRCHNDAQRDQVWRAQADHLFKKDEYVAAAECYAKSSIGFEEAVLKFIDKKQNVALKSYLLSKLDTLRRQDQTQTTLLVMWLIDIYLGMLSTIDAKLNAARANVGASGASQEQHTVVDEFEGEHATTQEELYSLVERYKNAVDPHTAYQLAESHGQREFWLHYASLRGDYERVVEYWMEKEEFIRALQVLGHYGTPEMLYHYAPVLMSTQPEALVDILMRQPNLTPSKLIPALMKYQPGHSGPTNQALRYLHFCTQRQMCRDPTVYNYYLTLLVHESTSSDESELMAFLTTYGKEMLYDPDYALRMCKRFGRIQSCVHLYSLLKLHEDAVDLALEHGDIELAQIHAERPEGDDKLCKRLWLKIAQHVIKANTSAADVMELVHRSNRLGVEDILPFFPDFTRVDDFKEDICTALEDYETQIQDLRSEMDESTRTAENMQRNMQGLKHRFAILNAEEACQLCDQPLWLRQFYAFPCQHACHADCLTRKIVSTCNRVQRRRIHELQSQSVEIMKQRRQLRLAPLTGKQTGESDEALEAQGRRVRKQLDTLVAGECVLCGEVMIKSVAEPFVTSDLAADESWTI
ncbi:tethering complex subunit [Linderina pennispora]|nr:tethering complex subunit [Linderina pennispora]